MTFNIQHGINGAGKYDLKYAVQTIAKVNPDLVGVQELTRNHPFYNCTAALIGTEASDHNALVATFAVK